MGNELFQIENFVTALITIFVVTGPVALAFLNYIKKAKKEHIQDSPKVLEIEARLEKLELSDKRQDRDHQEIMRLMNKMTEEMHEIKTIVSVNQEKLSGVIARMDSMEKRQDRMSQRLDK